ncbi:MAG: TetR family transcriptional regulator, partial [Calditrichaeota bacterium]|nr:TetR family transcriptional regulator [Calditrichota bacterium]
MNTFSERQQQIINAAIELIAEKGIQQLTIKNLSKKIGVVEG